MRIHDNNVETPVTQHRASDTAPAPIAATTTSVEHPVSTDVLTWRTHSISFKSISINKHLKAWMDSDATLRNFIYGSVVIFIALPNQLELTIPMPDQHVECTGLREFVLHRFEMRGSSVAPGVNEIHVMI